MREQLEPPEFADTVIDGKHIQTTFYSVEEFASAVESGMKYGPGPSTITSMEGSWMEGTVAEMIQYGKYGWDASLDEAMEVSEKAIETVQKEHELTTFHAVWDVTGSDVDVARYLNGEPENMIDYPMTTVSTVGRVVTLVVGGFYSAGVSAESIKARGHVVTAFALALAKLGYQLECWYDLTGTGHSNGYTGSVRVLVKGANDILDASKIQFMFAHPGATRALGFLSAHRWPAAWRKRMGIGHFYFSPHKLRRTFPEGTIYLPEVSGWSDRPDAADELKSLLRQAGVID